MIIPDKVKIGYKDYSINHVNGNVVDESKVCYGTIEYNNGVINISNLYSEDLQKCTLLHEAIHGIDDLFNIELEEKQVEALAKGLYTFVKDNPNIFKEEQDENK